MSPRTTIHVPLNRVEGDLEVSARIEDGVVVDAWCSGTMYRGFEAMLKGRSALDGLVLTPRVCGICSTSHLTAAARALDMVAGVSLPPNAVRIRNVAHLAETIQSDVRHSFLMFTADFVNPAYRDQPLHDEAVRRYQPFAGETVVEVIRQSKRILEVVAILGGQWPHSSYMVPGGVVSVPSFADLTQCQLLLAEYRQWYEHRILGCAIERWREVTTPELLEAWLEEDPKHRDSELGFFLRFARAVGLDRIGAGHRSFLSVGGYDRPEGDVNPRADAGGQLIRAGFRRGGAVEAFDQGRIAEHVAYSWYEGEVGGAHPWVGETRPYASGSEDTKYSWAKAPRYDEQPAETGPLAEALVAGDPLLTALAAAHGGASVLCRQLARIVRPATLIPAMARWLGEIEPGARCYQPAGEIVEGEGFGLHEATRGGLGHWVQIRDGVIEHYQIITPTAWNASPRDSQGVRGPMEEALIGAEVEDGGNPIRLGHIVRSFDACLVCTVHAVGPGRRSLGRIRVGATP